ncbi:ATP-binding protein, partial [bacterium]|nr:ATP-binding protein [bacterium]
MPLPMTSDLQWTLTRGGTFVACGRASPALPPGAYSVTLDNCGESHFRPHPLHTDDLVAFPASVSADVLAEVGRFWDTGDRFARLGFAHRRGYLFYGKQGCGKSSLIHQLIGRVTAAGHVAFFCSYPTWFRVGLARFREVEPD